jgi:hypothetical protein
VVFFNYGVDTGTVWKSAPFHEPILWRHVSWDHHSPDRKVKEQSRWGWLFHRRVKTGKAFYRPINHVVHAHLQSILPESPLPDTPRLPGRPGTPKRALSRTLRSRRHPTKDERQEWHRRALGVEGPP